MYEQAYSLMDIIQILLMVLTCWVCYKAGFSRGVNEMAEVLGLTEDDEDEQEREEK